MTHKHYLDRVDCHGGLCTICGLETRPLCKQMCIKQDPRCQAPMLQHGTRQTHRCNKRVARGMEKSDRERVRERTRERERERERERPNLRQRARETDRDRFGVKVRETCGQHFRKLELKLPSLKSWSQVFNFPKVIREQIVNTPQIRITCISRLVWHFPKVWDFA